MDGLEVWTKEARLLGFDGVGCIHPRQVRVVHEAFTPSEEEIERAQRIMVAYEEALIEGRGVVVVDGKMIDAPVVERARRTLHLAQVAGKLTSQAGA
jgi:citrate lyase subunit beta/citryl-CoA lyase